MTNHTDYDAWLNERVGGRPTFTVGGETFTVRQKLPWRKYGRMILAIITASGEGALDANEQFLLKSLIPADRARMQELLNADNEDRDDDEGVITNEQLQKIINDLMDFYSGKDDESPDGSSDVPSASGQPSKPVSLNARS
jgi:hypothetical protein